LMISGLGGGAWDVHFHVRNVCSDDIYIYAVQVLSRTLEDGEVGEFFMVAR
jgi:hypothetical protein